MTESVTSSRATVAIDTSVPLHTAMEPSANGAHHLPMKTLDRHPPLIQNAKQIGLRLETPDVRNEAVHMPHPNVPIVTRTIFSSQLSSDIVLPKIKPKLAQTLHALQEIVHSGNFPDGKLPTLPQLSIQLHRRSDYVEMLLRSLQDHGIVTFVNRRWCLPDSPTEQEVRRSPLQPNKFPVLVFGNEPPLPSSSLYKRLMEKQSRPSSPEPYIQLPMDLPFEAKKSEYEQLPLKRRPNRVSKIASEIRPEIEKLNFDEYAHTSHELGRRFHCSHTIGWKALQILAEEGWIQIEGNNRYDGYRRTYKQQEGREELETPLVERPKNDVLATAQRIADVLNAMNPKLGATAKNVLSSVPQLRDHGTLPPKLAQIIDKGHIVSSNEDQGYGK